MLVAFHCVAHMLHISHVLRVRVITRMCYLHALHVCIITRMHCVYAPLHVCIACVHHDMHALRVCVMTCMQCVYVSLHVCVYVFYTHALHACCITLM